MFKLNTTSPAMAPALSLSFSLALLCTAAVAQTAPAGRPDPLRPQGPVTINAQSGDMKDGVAIYTGDVSLESQTLKMYGDRVELRRSADGQYQAKISGNPARLEHAAAPGSGADAVPVSAQAKNLNYNSATGLIEILGGAKLMRGTDAISGETIRYNAIERRIQASGGPKERVKIVIQPPAAPAPKKPSP